MELCSYDGWISICGTETNQTTWLDVFFSILCTNIHQFLFSEINQNNFLFGITANIDANRLFRINNENSKINSNSMANFKEWLFQFAIFCHIKFHNKVIFIVHVQSTCTLNMYGKATRLLCKNSRCRVQSYHTWCVWNWISMYGNFQKWRKFYTRQPKRTWHTQTRTCTHRRHVTATFLSPMKLSTLSNLVEREKDCVFKIDEC